VVHEHRQEIIEVPAPPAAAVETIQQVTTVEHRSHSHSRSRAPSPARTHVSHHSHHSHGAPLIVHAERREESGFIERREHDVEIIDRSDHIAVGPLALAVPSDRHLGGHRKDERAIRAEIRALEAEKEALRAEKRASRELRRADKIRREGRESGELVLYEERVERFREPEGGVRIEKDKKGRMSISVPKNRY
jgi:hypothetical protein